MKKKIIIAATFTACLALCAAVWPQTEVVEKTPAPSEATAVTAPKATIAELKTEVETVRPTEKEKTEIPQQEQIHEAAPEPKPVPAEMPPSPEVQPKPEKEPVTEAAHEPYPEQTTEPPVAQTTIEPPSGDMVYVEGFGWIESQGPNHGEYAEDMYENGNKIGTMG